MIFIEGGIICCVFFKLRGGGKYFFFVEGGFSKLRRKLFCVEGGIIFC